MAEKVIDELVVKAQEALEEYMKLNQEQIDKITHAMTLAGVENHVQLAKMAVEETGRGVFEDKIIKNIFSTEYIWNSIKKLKTVGVINKNEAEGYMEIAEPMGIIVGVTPVTNPTSTAMFKAIICAKTRNPIIFGFHPSAQKCSAHAAKILRDAAIKAGAPENCIQWISEPSIEATSALMNHKGVNLILATGGTAMVRSAHSAGKPALGVGPGNVPCYIEKTANLERACTDLIISKTFDNGMICASEQAVIVDTEIAPNFEKIMRENNCYFLNEEEIQKLSGFMINPEKKSLNPVVVGQNAYWIAKQVQIDVPKDTKILIAKLGGVGVDFPLSVEKLSPVLAYYTAKDSVHGFEIAKQTLNFHGLGHTAVIHSTDEDIIEEFGLQMQSGRVIVNSPSSQGAIGDVYNTGIPSLTLGCGTYGKNSTTSNVSAVNLINVKRVYKRMNNMQWFKIPPKIYFEHGSVRYLEAMEGIERVFIVTDATMMKLGYVDKILYHLNNCPKSCKTEIFYDVEPDPDVETILKGTQVMKTFKPDCIIALGGGSAIDAAKGMWMFYEHPELEFNGLKLKFMDIKKRVYEIPKTKNKCKFVAIPTTSGTGSEVTAFSVITDRRNGGIKYPIADYAITPDVAIIDPQFVASLPKIATADTGMDVLTHAIESYVSILANDYTEALSLQAIGIIFEYLVKAYENGEKNPGAREKMHNASCIAGMAFTNAFLGLNHSMAHKLGGEYSITHGRANAVLLPYVIEYNAVMPTKFAIFPKYEKFIADKKYTKIANFIGVGGSTTEEGVKNLVEAIKSLNKKLGIPQNIKEFGIPEDRFLNDVQKLAENAHADQCTAANPRYPLIDEIKEIYLKAYYG